MSWRILINTEGTHFKFWSAEVIHGEFTGRVVYGRIGHRGTPYEYAIREVGRKYHSKLRRGYVLFRENATSPSPSSSDVMMHAPIVGRTRPRPQPRAHPHPRTRTRAPHPATHTARGTREVHSSISQARYNQQPSYKTNRTGYIMQYRQGYEREEPKNYKIIGKEEIFQNQRTVNIIKTFYDGIPRTAVAKKPPFGAERESTQIFGRHTGRFRFVVDGDTPIAAFEIFRNGNSRFLYVRTAQTDYIYVLKYILNIMAVLARDANRIVIRARGSTLINKLRDLLPNASFSRLNNTVQQVTIDRNELLRFHITQSVQRFQKL